MNSSFSLPFVLLFCLYYVTHTSVDIDDTITFSILQPRQHETLLMRDMEFGFELLSESDPPHRLLPPTVQLCMKIYHITPNSISSAPAPAPGDYGCTTMSTADPLSHFHVPPTLFLLAQW